MMGKGQSLQLTVLKKKMDSHMLSRKGMGYYFISNIKINTEWIKDLDVRL